MSKRQGVCKRTGPHPLFGVLCTSCGTTPACTVLTAGPQWVTVHNSSQGTSPDKTYGDTVTAVGRCSSVLLGRALETSNCHERLYMHLWISSAEGKQHAK